MTEPTRQRRKRRQLLTDLQVAKLPRKLKPYFHPDPELVKFGIRVRRSGAAYTVITRDAYGKQRWVKIGDTTEFKIDEARDRAREVIRRVEAGLPAKEPPPPKPDSVADTAEQWLQRHVEKNQHISATETRRVVEKYILPHWRDRVFVDIRRSDIADLMDSIEDESGPAMADRVLATLRSIATWVQSRNEDYRPPFVKKMQRVAKQNRKRKRYLDDDELRTVWHAAADAGAFGAVIRLLLLTAQRRAKVITLRWDDIDANGVWTIRTAPREKNNAEYLKLPAEAIEIIKSQPRFVGNPYVFAGGNGAARGFNFSRGKRDFDKKCGVTGWVLHDLRRTSRSLMSRAGVISEHAERVLGHAVGGIEATYNRHAFDDEKEIALAKLAALIGRIVDPPEGGNVVAIDEAPKGRSAARYKASAGYAATGEKTLAERAAVLTPKPRKD
jgi:integrase